MYDRKKIIHCINDLGGISPVKLIDIIKFISMDNLVECVPTGISGLESLDKQMRGENEELTEQLLLDAISIASGRDSISVSTQIAYVYAKASKVNVVMVSIDEMRSRMYGAVESSIERDNGEKQEAELKSEEESATGDLEEVEKKEEKIETRIPKRTEEDKELLSFYSSIYKGIVSELLKRYSGLFASGYEITKPSGILSESGILRLSGNKLVREPLTMSLSKMYQIFKSKLNFKEIDNRSGKEIFTNICREFVSGSRVPLYFPKKLLEYAYGRRASGLNAESENTYEPHDDASSWSKYSSGVLRDALNGLAEGIILWYLHTCLEEGSDPRSDSVAEKVFELLKYFQSCMSVCILMVDFRTVDGVPTLYRIRVCDFENRLGTYNLSELIIREAFGGSTGDVPFSYNPRIEDETYVKEYAHEFNRDASQAMPFFAYKAYDAMLSQGLEVSWDNVIFGKSEDGTILRNGTHGVALNKHLTHHINAGSRSGKGVMTLALLGAAISSKKNIFYLDRKPDMASLLKHLSPNMFVVNGGSYSANDDNYKEFANSSSMISSARIPEEAMEILGRDLDWNNFYGDLFYMRAIELLMGIIMARGSGKSGDSNLGGDDGILVVVDEFSNFQNGYNEALKKFMSYLPPSLSFYEVEKEKADNKGKDGTTATKNYNRVTLYALSYINHLIESASYLSSKKDAGFDPLEVGLSDIFVIGQSLDKGPIDVGYFKSCISSRYKRDDRGVSGNDKEFIYQNGSFAYSYLFFKTADAFFGANRDGSRSAYLAQTNPASASYGKLDLKAKNFCYLNDFTDKNRVDIVESMSKVRENIEISNRCVYFKPFLVLNDNTPQYTDYMFYLCTGAKDGKHYLDKEEILQEYPDENDNSMLNRAVGFEDYLRRMKADNYSEILAKGAVIADYAVKSLGYSGTWFEFITDLRPEWMFTVEDVVKALLGGTVPLMNPETNPVTKEYYSYLRELGGSDSGDESLVDNVGDYYEDFSDMGRQVADADDRLSDALGDNATLNLSEEVPLWDDMSDDVLEESNISESGYSEDREDIDSLINEHIRALEKLGVKIPVENTGTWRAIDPNTGTEKVGGFDSAPDTEFGSEFEKIDYQEDINSYDDMVRIITEDVIKKFGGLDRIHSLKVVGGSIIVNGYYYRCKVKDMFARNIPYDIRREINSGSIDKLFDYGCIRKMRHIRDLEFDSVSFVYDYVSGPLGFGNSINIPMFFRDFRSLQVLTVGRNRFTRSDYVEKSMGNDLFYSPRNGRILAEAVESRLGTWNSSVWGWTKRVCADKRRKGWQRVAAGVAGGTVSAATLVGNKSVKVGKKVPGVVRDFVRSAKDLFS